MRMDELVAGSRFLDFDLAFTLYSAIIESLSRPTRVTLTTTSGHAAGSEWMVEAVGDFAGSEAATLDSLAREHGCGVDFTARRSGRGGYGNSEVVAVFYAMQTG